MSCRGHVGTNILCLSLVCYKLGAKLAKRRLQLKNKMADHDELLQAHRNERRELQAKIQNLKHSVPKGDKKKKREVMAEVAMLEAQLEEKQNKELEDLASQKDLANGRTQVDAVTESLEDIALVEGGLPKQSRTSKAEKRREKKRQMDAQREKEIAEQEVKNQFLPRAVEDRAFKTLLAQQRLAIHEVPSDGNCMYKAVEHQLHLVGTKKSMKTLRRDAAEYMLANAEEFLPFLTSASSGGVMTREEFEEYCDKVSGTTTWGGQLELRALSHVCQVPIRVVQASGPCIEVGLEYSAPPLLLSYHRHMYEMGEHYNSLVPAAEEATQDDFVTH
ncbi:deubiquitinase OTUD6B isoform X2 [Ixodes scapularis]|uniref:deubiquitinase OTUD6B isoform X2 n=1 Tax=Ixodes scapularis TaxID=6945 RepID=UPI001A9DA949|nr:deubiquitinase OTUD6B isoform X2 [Ixodes scapularis]